MALRRHRFAVSDFHPFMERFSVMPKSREELRRELQASLGLSDTPKTAKAPAVAKAPAANGNPFKARLNGSHKTEVVEDTAVAVAEPEVEPVAEFVSDEPDTTPVEDFVDAVTGLVDYIADNRTALKEFLLRLR